MTNFYRGYQTQTAGTAITEAIPPYQNAIPRIMEIIYEAAGTEHTITVMRPIADTLTSARSASGTNTLELDKIDAGKIPSSGAYEALATSDWIGWICENEMIHADSIASVSGNTVTLDNNLTTDVEKGAKVFLLYEVGRSTHIQVKGTASTRIEIEGPIQAGYGTYQGQKAGARDGTGDMLLLHIDNITAAGKLHYVRGNYVGADNVVAG